MDADQQTLTRSRPVNAPPIDGYAAILVHVQPHARRRLEAAREVAERFGAALIGVGARAIPPVAAGPVTGVIQAQWLAAACAAANAEMTIARSMFGDARTGLRHGCAWKQELSIPVDAMSQAARGADLIVASVPPRSTSLYADATPADLAMTSGRPVLVVAERAPALRAERIVLAWKDTREARRAMADALPFLRAASDVMVLSVTAEDLSRAQAVVDDVACALGRHGVTAHTKVVAASAHAGRLILDEAAGFGADLVVAGCYGHSRFGERMFGGTTRDLLAQQVRHVLLSH